ncbi:MATE family efflux transporter [Sphaerochaeta halotolerans]|uniref:MATE family efflux transporter n=1 Tax=Sphaerochaeta halotolerans TaxID=2293840 RepID=UPI0013719800|nr:MATE family efflux transporter [Sphaerochaeta halotolerans]MXI86428.1 MATE family efflux transporter [Sphaerochaeta halotolerans]
MQPVQENKMGVKPIPSLVLSMSFPIMLSMLVQALYNIVDSMFVSHYSQQALTAVTLAFPMQNLLIAVSVGTSVGVNSLLSRKLGAKDITSARKAAGNGLTLSVISWAFFAFIGLFFSKTFVSFFTNDPELITMGTQYISICLIFSLGLFIDIICERILQGTGDTVHPMIIQSTGAIVNILLDPILIFGLFGMPRMGVMGAAIATVFAQHISTVLAIYYVRRNKEIVLKKSSFRLEKQTVKDIYAVGIPTIIMQAIGTILITSLNKILIGFSTSAVAVFGIYFRLQSFIFMPVFGLNTGMIPVIGYNYGARKPKRITATIKVGLVVAITIMGIGTALFMLFPHILLGWFDATPEMIAIGTVAMQRISMGFVFAGVSIVLIALFQGMGYGYLSMINSVSRQLVFLLPAAYLLGKYVGLDALWYSFFISELASFTLTLYFFRKIYKTKIKTMTA